MTQTAPAEPTPLTSPQPSSPPSRSPSDPFRSTALALAALFLVTLPSLIWIGYASVPESGAHPPTSIETAAAEQGVPLDTLLRGHNVFVTTCATCHGRDGAGIVQLGKPLRNSAYVQQASDEELFRVILNGRLPNDPANTSGVAMPARGNNPALTAEDIRAVVAYIRTLQEPGAEPVSMDQWIVEKPAAPAGAGPGYDLFVASCSACHGADGNGLPNMGKPLTTSEFVAGKTDDELLAFIKQGRPIWDPANTTGVDMPPKGGNPALTDDDLRLIIAHIRSLQEAARKN